MKVFLTVLALSSLLVGCNSQQTSPTTGQAWPPSASALKTIQSDYDAALADATNSIPYAADLARLFPRPGTFFSYYVGGAGPSSFNMENLLFDRYHLTMTVPVTFDISRRRVNSFGEPEFLLQEISVVTKERKTGSLGNVETLRPGKSGDRSLRFGAGEWKKVVEARGDFSVIGFTLLTNSPAPGFDDLRKNWEMRMKKQP